MKVKAIILTAFLTLFVSGCAQQTFTIASNQGEKAQETSQAFFVSGIGQEKKINADEVCGGADKVVKVEVQQTFVNGLLSFVTFGIYTPREARVYCKK